MIIKRSVLLIASIVMTLCYSQASAEITLKKSFFSGWMYSLDGIEFEKVGSSGFELHRVMQNNAEAVTYMLKYKRANTWADVTGLVGGFFIGWPIGGYYGSGREWKNSYTTMIYFATPFIIASMLFESDANNNLKKAVALYNDDNQSLGFMLNVKPLNAGQQITPLFGLRYEF